MAGQFDHRAFRLPFAGGELTRRVASGLAAAALLVLLAQAWSLSAGVPWVRVTAVAVFALGALRPADALLLIAGLGPLAATLGDAWRTPVPLAELIFLATAAGWAVRRAARRAGGPGLPAALGAPLVCFAVVIVASVAVQAWVDRALVGPAEWLPRLQGTVERGLLLDRRHVPGLEPGVVMLQGLVLFGAAVAVGGGGASFGSRLAAMAALGATGAAALNVLRLVTASLSAEAPVTRARELLATVRINVHFADLNAAGSYFALMFFPAAALAATTWRRAIVPGLGVALIFAAAWLSGSRAAIASIVLVAAAAAARQGWHRPAMRARAVLVLGACAATAVGFLVAFPNPVVGDSLTRALEIRTGLAAISLEMFAGAPLFGVGLGAFYDRSAPLLESSPVGRFYFRENAHNNFLQILAELGLAGSLCLTWLLWAVIGRIRRHPPVASSMGRAVTAGLAAFALTALMGHPLLTAQVSHAFWLMLGTAARLHEPLDAGAGGSRRPIALAAAFCAAMIFLLPWRAQREVGAQDFEHIRYGVSKWHTDDDGVRYQTFRGEATVFVAETSAAVSIPLRAPDAGDASAVEVRMDGRLVDIIQIGPGWREYRVLMAGTPARRGFFRIDLTARSPGGTGQPREVWIGRLQVIPRTP